MTRDAQPHPLTLVIFGASGDLAKRKLIPAIYNLYKSNYLPEQFVILGVSRSKMSDDEFRGRVFHDAGFVDFESEDKAKVKEFAGRLFYQAIDTNNSDDYGLVKQRMESLAVEFKTGDDAIFYLSTPPVLYDLSLIHI